MNGILLVNKPIGMTSHDVIAKLRKIFNTKKIGHCGTLDPNASGLLICLIGNATKISNYLNIENKRYLATFKLGLSTTTQDLDGDIVSEKPFLNDISIKDIQLTLFKFLGKLKQQPSIYSDIKVNGKKLYDYARNNEEVIIPIRDIIIEEISLVNVDNDLISINVLCSSGTYIRTLCFDIANELGYPGVLTKLERISTAHFSLDEAYTLDDISNNNYELLDISAGLSDFDIVELDNSYLNDVKNGKPLKIEHGNKFILKIDNENIALYNASENGIAKMIRGLW
jgi:tRNA pseudouridine55 synthase